MRSRFCAGLASVAWGCLVSACVAAAVVPRETRLNDGWRFLRGDAVGAEQPDFDDASWRQVDLPHDWSIEDLPPVASEGPAVVTAVPGRWRFRQGDDAAWKDSGFDDSAWQEVHLPASWEEHSGVKEDGVYGWFRRRIGIPEALRGKAFDVALGTIDDVDEAFLNGVRIGGTGRFPPEYESAWDRPRVYRVPAGLARGDDADVLAVRVYDGQGNGGINGGAVPPVRSGPFDTASSAGRESTGWVVGGTGWYRKTFRLPGLSPGDRVEVRFDGVYMDSDAWINGRHLGGHPYGYTAYGFDLTPFLNRNGDNVLAVRVRNEGANSRWYSGSGLYRPVALTVTRSVRIPTWGVTVTTPEASGRRAVIQVAVEVENKGSVPVRAGVRVRLTDPNGWPLKGGETAVRVPAGGTATAIVRRAVSAPRRWSPDTPALHRAVTFVQVGGRLVDRVETVFGIRTIEVDPAHGLRINGEPIELKGGCVHHDNGPLGSAAIGRAEERRVERLKAAGFNAVRTSHNPPSTAFLDACDRLGMLVMDEAFDMWEVPKKPQDYSRFFKEHWKADLESMVRRDRNHPCVFAWSIGNEIPERADHPGLEIAQRLIDHIRRLDAGRPVTQAICGFWDHKGREWTAADPAFALLDIGGCNYTWREYEKDHERAPDRVICGTESHPRDAFENWEAVERHPYVIGDFVWTALDYLGESGIGRAWVEGEEPGGFLGAWPWHVAGCGDLDILGFRKPQSHYREALWRPDVLHIAVARPLPPGKSEKVTDWGWPAVESHWTWPGQEGKTLQVHVYSSCRRVALMLNGREIGSAPTTRTERNRAVFDVPYEPGELMVVGETAEGRQKTVTLHTAGAPVALRIHPEQPDIRASKDDLGYATVEVVDETGTPVPYARSKIRLRLEGPATLAALANADPTDPAGYQGAERAAWHGVVQAIVRPTGQRGAIVLHAEAEGLEGAKARIRAR